MKVPVLPELLVGGEHLDAAQSHVCEQLACLRVGAFDRDDEKLVRGRVVGEPTEDAALVALDLRHGVPTRRPQGEPASKARL